MKVQQAGAISVILFSEKSILDADAVRYSREDK